MLCFAAVLYPLGILTILMNFIGNKYIVHGHATAIVQCVLTLICLATAAPSILSVVTLISSVCGLLKRNIRAYRELVEMLCLQTTLVYQRELQKQQSRQQTEATEQADKQKSTTDPAEVARARTRLDPLVNTLQRQVQKREHFLVAVSKAVIKGEVRNLTNSAYAFILALYFFQLFAIGITFIKLRLGGSVSFVEYFFSVAMVVVLLVCVVALAIPLVAMSGQAQAWISLTKSLTSHASTKVSEILSPQKNPLELHDHHAKLQDDFTWSICGMDMSYASIGKAVAAYFGALWVAIFLPAITDYQEQLKQELEELQTTLNTTMAELSETVDGTLSG